MEPHLARYYFLSQLLLGERIWFLQMLSLARPRRSILHINYQKLAGLQEPEFEPTEEDSTDLTVQGTANIEVGFDDMPVNQRRNDPTVGERLGEGRTELIADRVACSVCGRSRHPVGPLEEEQRQQLAAVSRGRLVATAATAVCPICRADMDAVSRKLTELETKFENLDRRDLGQEAGFIYTTTTICCIGPVPLPLPNRVNFSSKIQCNLL